MRDDNRHVHALAVDGAPDRLRALRVIAMHGTTVSRVCGIAAAFSSMVVLGFAALIGVVMVI